MQGGSAMQGWGRWVLMLVGLTGLPLLMGQGGCGSGLVSIDEPTEVRIGQQGAADIERQYGVTTTGTQAARVQRIGASVARVSRRPNLPWSFRILNVTDVNALSLPGGPIYVTSGLINLGIPDAELAGILGHEVAHTDQRHAVEAIQRSMTQQLLADLILGNSQATRTAANIALQYAVELPHSRQDEYEADAVGTRLAYNAGYPANGLLAFLQRLQQISGPSRTPEWMRTHPLTEDRIARERTEVARIQGQPRPVPIALTEENLKVMRELAHEDEESTAATKQEIQPTAPKQ
ncbi:MAG: M48 family metalloprotease [Armatimonadota bacterium]